MLTGYNGTMVSMDTSDKVGALEATELLEGEKTLTEKRYRHLYQLLPVFRKVPSISPLRFQNALIGIRALKLLRIDGAATLEI